MWRASLFALLAAVAALPAAAQTTTCTGANLALSLGGYDSYQPGPLDASGVFTVTCTRNGGPQNMVVTVGLGPSFNSGTIATRRLKLASGTDVLTYNLYRDAGRALVWGDTIGTNTMTQAVSIPNNTSIALTFTIFGRIDALQDVRAGSYGDSLTVTVTF